LTKNTITVSGNKAMMSKLKQNSTPGYKLTRILFRKRGTSIQTCLVFY